MLPGSAWVGKVISICLRKAVGQADAMRLGSVDVE